MTTINLPALTALHDAARKDPHNDRAWSAFHYAVGLAGPELLRLARIGQEEERFRLRVRAALDAGLAAGPAMEEPEIIARCKHDQRGGAQFCIFCLRAIGDRATLRAAELETALRECVESYDDWGVSMANGAMQDRARAALAKGEK